MAVTLVYVDPQGIYRASKSGRIIKSYNPSRHQVVSISMNQKYREESRRKNKERLADARSNRGPLSSGQKEKMQAGRRAASESMVRGASVNQARYSAAGEPYDAPTLKTYRMLAKLHKKYPHLGQELEKFQMGLRGNYIQYNSRAHAFDIYSHKQTYLGTYQLPGDMRDGHAKSAPSHYERLTYPGGATRVYVAGQGPDNNYDVRRSRR
jgi:hypothetical protein